MPEASHSAALWHPCLQSRQWITFAGSSFLSAVIPWSRRQSLHHNQQLESCANYPQEPSAEPKKRPQIFSAIKVEDTFDSGKHCCAAHICWWVWRKGGCERDNILYCSWFNNEPWRLLLSRQNRRSTRNNDLCNRVQITGLALPR